MDDNELAARWGQYLQDETEDSGKNGFVASREGAMDAKAANFPPLKATNTG